MGQPPRGRSGTSRGFLPVTAYWGSLALGAGALAAALLLRAGWPLCPAALALTVHGLIRLWAPPYLIRRWRLRNLFRRRHRVADLARRLDVPEERLRAFTPRYREVRIPKRSGGTRLLHVPDDATKELQRRILRRLLTRLRAHPAAFGFERGRSIAHHAAQHVGRAVVLRFDVVDFFPTTRAGRVERMFLRLGWDRESAALLTRLTTHAGGLPQGAPTSPRLSNLVNSGMDRALRERLGELHGRYTRYADDITVSFPEDWHACVERTKARVKDELGRRGYVLHERRKLSVRRQHQRQVVNGLVVNGRVALPRVLRRRLRAVRHHLATGRPATLTPEQLRGWEAFEAMVRAQGADVPPPHDGCG